MINNLKVGADPELFLVKNGKPLSAEGLIGGTKEEPKPIGRKGCSLQEDNVMAEFNIPPSVNAKDFNENIEFMLDAIDTLARINGAELLIDPSAEFDKESLNTSQAQEFGCSPDINAYSFEENPRVEIFSNIRVAGGHIHIGYDQPNEELNLLIVRVLDIFLGLPSVVMDEDTTRKEYYGNAGSYRNKSYGVEYRTLSNFWLKTEETRLWVFNQILKAIDFIEEGRYQEISEKMWSTIELAINDNDKSLALSLEEEIKKTTTVNK